LQRIGNWQFRIPGTRSSRSAAAVMVWEAYLDGDGAVAAGGAAVRTNFLMLQSANG
jgi:hypothetical protein